MDENAKRHCAFIIYHQFYELWSWGASDSRVVDSFAITSYVDRHRYSPFRGVEKRSCCESIIRGTLNYHEKQVGDACHILYIIKVFTRILLKFNICEISALWNDLYIINDSKFAIFLEYKTQNLRILAFFIKTKSKPDIFLLQFLANYVYQQI